jgi:hypothetical protein
LTDDQSKAFELALWIVILQAINRLFNGFSTSV